MRTFFQLMKLEIIKIMGYEQILLHLFGDFIIQNDWMAMNKKKPGIKGDLACLIHTITYSLPFLLITSTHYVIDRTKIIDYFIMLKNGEKDIKNFGFNHERPFAVSIWIYIFVDNTFHLIINYLAIKYIII